MLVEMMVGEQGGRVIHAGSTEWCVGLQEGREEPLTVRGAGRSSEEKYRWLALSRLAQDRQQSEICLTARL